jgi:hypothetical protein
MSESNKREIRVRTGELFTGLLTDKIKEMR